MGLSKQNNLKIAFCGLIGVFGCFVTAFFSAIDVGFVCIAYPVLCAIIYFVIYYEKRNITYLLVLCLGVFAIFNFVSLLDGAKALYNGMVDVYASNDTYIFNKFIVGTFAGNGVDAGALSKATITFLYFYCIYTMVVMIILKQRSGYWLLLLLTLCIFMTTIFYKTMPFLPLIGMVIAFCLSLMFLSATKYLAIREQEYANYLKRILIGSISLCFLLMVILPKPLFQKSSTIESIRTKIALAIESAVMKNTQPKGEIDLRKAGNRLYNNVTHLKITSSVKQQLYLKEFSGSSFENDVWKELSESQYDNGLIEFSEVYKWISTNQTTWEKKPTMATLTIQDERPSPYYTPHPYYLDGLSSELHYVEDMYIEAVDGQHHFEFWDDENVASITSAKKDVAYERFILNSYTKVPSDIKAMFDGMQIMQTAKKAGGSYETIYPIIRDYLQQRAVYTLSPGNTPEGKGFVEYFLNESKKGYCVHFATTATMMFRYLNIPARYVEGYRVDTSSFDEFLNANVKDSDAHAWVEVFDEHKGWVPLEVTPAAPEEDPIQNNQPTTTPNQTQTPDDPTNDPQQNGNNGTQGTNNKDTETDVVRQKTLDKQLLAQIATIAMGVVLLVALFAQRQLRFKKWVARLTQRDRRNAILAMQMYIEKWRQYQEIDDSKVHSIFDKAQYSKHPIQEEEYARVYEFTKTASRQVFKSASIPLKLKAYFIDAIK